MIVTRLINDFDDC